MNIGLRGIPDYTERARLAKRSEETAHREHVRRIRHICGHEQGHVIKAGPQAREDYKRIHAQPCGACALEHEGSYDGPEWTEEDADGNLQWIEEEQ